MFYVHDINKKISLSGRNLRPIKPDKKTVLKIWNKPNGAYNMNQSVYLAPSA